MTLLSTTYQEVKELKLLMLFIEYMRRVAMINWLRESSKILKERLIVQQEEAPASMLLSNRPSSLMKGTHVLAGSMLFA